MAYSKPRCKAKKGDGKRCTNPAVAAGACRIIAHKEQVSRDTGGTAQRARARGKAKKKAKKKAPSSRLAKVLRQQEAFLEAIRTNGAIVGAAAEAAGISRSRHYEWLEDVERFPNYGEQFDEAFEDGCDNLEVEAHRRAHDGVEEPVFGRGPGANAGTQVVGHVRKYSDRLLEVLLRARRPAVFGSRVSAELTGRDGAPLGLGGLDLSKLSTATLEAIHADLAEAEE
jgi:hypothetical protein